MIICWDKGILYKDLISSHCVIANLWDITDKDIDKFSLSLFKKWKLFKQDILKYSDDEADEEILESNSLLKDCSIISAMQESRHACVLRFLNGASPVCYGLPVYL